MAYPPDLVKVNFVFNLGTVDVAEMGFFMSRNHVPGNDTPWASDVANIAQQMRDFWLAHVRGSSFGGGVSGNRVDAYHLDTTGHALDKGTSVFAGDSIWGGTQSNTLPWETTIGVTLLAYDPASFTPNAAQKRGRFNLPPLGVNAVTGAAGALGGDTKDNLVSDLKDFLAAAKHIALPDPTVPGGNDTMNMGVLSRPSPAKGRPNATFRGLLYSYVDNKFDVQRRRQNKQVPSRYPLVTI